VEARLFPRVRTHVLRTRANFASHDAFAARRVGTRAASLAVMRSLARPGVCLVGLLLVGCAGEQGHKASSPGLESATVARGAAMSEPRPEVGAGYRLFALAASCWLGGLYSDAVGETGGAREVGIEGRCRAVLRAIGEADGAYYPLRALDGKTVAEVVSAVRRAAHGDRAESGNRDALARLTTAVADGAREAMHARKAADKVKQVFQTFDPTDRTANKLVADAALRRSDALTELLGTTGPYAEAGRMVGLLLSVDRVEIVRGLPKHLKIDGLRAVTERVFGVPAPEVPDAPLAVIPKGAWLDYLERTAAAAGHPIPSDARDPQNREPLAWNGVLAGFADQLQRSSEDPILGAAVRGVIARLDAQKASALVVYEAHAPADR
jgi:hypothetical protein